MSKVPVRGIADDNTDDEELNSGALPIRLKSYAGDMPDAENGHMWYDSDGNIIKGRQDSTNINFSGYSGTSGYSGDSTSGYSGLDGTSGYSGYSGVSSDIDIGDIVWSLRSSKTNFLIGNGTISIGNDDSNATNKGSVYEALFTFAWNSVTESGTSGDKGYILLTSGTPGTGVTKGGSAVIDWGADRKIEINLIGLAFAGYHGGDSDFGALGKVSGAKTEDLEHNHGNGEHTHLTNNHTQSTGTLVASATEATFPSASITSQTFVGATGVSTGGPSTLANMRRTHAAGIGGASADTGANGTTENAGSTAQNNIQPTIVKNVFVKYQ